MPAAGEPIREPSRLTDQLNDGMPATWISTPSARWHGVIRSNDPQLEIELRYALADITTDAQPRFRDFDINIVADHESSRYTLRRSTGPDISGLSRQGALNALIAVINRIALDLEPERLHLHAAVVSKHGRGVVICAPSGTGKSVLALSLLLRGWVYLSDEAAALRIDDPLIRTLPKPVALKASARALLAEDLEKASVVWNSDDPLFLAASALGQIGTSTAPCLVVLLKRSGRQEPAIRDIERSVCTAALIEQTMDSQRFGPTALATLADLCRRSRCLELDVGTVSDTCDALESALESTHPDAPPVVENMTSLGLGNLPDGVVDVLIDDLFVVHSTSTGAVAALDPAGSELWSFVKCGRMGADRPLEEAERAFLDRLYDLGLSYPIQSES